MLDWTAGLEYRARRTGVPTFLVTPVRWMATLRAGIHWDALDQLRVTTPLGVPVLLFHGEADRYAPFSVSEAFARGHPQEVTLARYATGDHVEAWNVDSRAYAETLERWFTEHGIVGARP